jgi:hypothetical protein
MYKLFPDQIYLNLPSPAADLTFLNFLGLSTFLLFAGLLILEGEYISVLLPFLGENYVREGFDLFDPFVPFRFAIFKIL